MKRFILMLSVCILSIPLASAWGKGAEKEGRLSPELIAKELKLTPEQRAQFESVRTEMLEATIMNTAHLKIARLNLEKLFRDDNPDAKEVAKYVDEINKYRDDNFKAHIQNRIKIHHMLSVEQRDHLRELMADKGRHGGREIIERMRWRRDLQTGGDAGEDAEDHSPAAEDNPRPEEESAE